jgi:prolyl oligopeptidase
MLTYPGTRIDKAHDTLAGVSFPDPYRWLEDKSEDVQKWQQAQAQLAGAHVREWPHFERLRQLVARFSTERFVALPRYSAGKWFRTRVAEGASQAQALVADEPMGDGQVLFDPLTENPQRPPFLSWIVPSPDGCTLALGVCVDGSENNTIRLIDVATSRVLADPPQEILMDNWSGGVHWLPDSSGFFFNAMGTSRAPIDIVQRVYLHRRFPVPTTVPVDVPWVTPNDFRMVVVSRDGRYAVALERNTNPIPVAIATLAQDPLRWRPFVTSVAGTLGGHVVGERYVAVTDVGAPRGRLVAIPLDAADPNDPELWEELVPQSNTVLRTVTPVGEVLYLTNFVDTYARVDIVDCEGQSFGEVPLPGLGAVSELPYPMMNLVPKGHPEKFLFGFSSLTVSPGIYSHTPGQVRIETLQAPHVRLENTVVEDRWAVSADGTHIPYHLVRRADVSAAQPQPALINAYGGFNAPWVPQFPGPMAAFVAAGGLLVHAHLRGGGEFGLEWWQGGRLVNKQNCYNDLYAIAEDLIATNRSTPQLLAVTGGSNGGQMAGVAATQRPELWKVVVPRVPALDLIGSCRDTYGRRAVAKEMANIEDPEEVRRLATFSPYHLVRDGVRYPAVFLLAGDTDPRCPPWHARKFAARLQAATAGSAPILVHIWENVGHGWATDKSIAVTEHTEWLAFTLRHLGVRDWIETSNSSEGVAPVEPQACRL